ncbi:MAG: hypothetical protein JSW17_04855 [Candidatus Omnitrophota bacterium]|nr:MAG: hypothetical protein JSW17_04855 [Candidatus Omnitrophota bacterium]
MNPANLEKVCVVGWGESGISLVRLLLTLKKEVKVTELRERNEFAPQLIDTMSERGVEFEFGGHSPQFIKDCDLVILSPGVDPATSAVVKNCKDLCIPYCGEVEFSFWLTKARFIAITGTNGKTTTSFLTYRLLKENKKRVFLGGNIGIPVSSFILKTKPQDLVVLEVSSCQLETIIKFRPYVAALLNFEPDHLDRHPSLDDYFKAKMNIFRNQSRDDWALINERIGLRSDIEKHIRAQLLFFSKEFDNENYSCVYRIGSIFGLSKADCMQLFSSHKGLPHRMQLIRSLGGVIFINDSKATNPYSTIWALKNTKTPIVLIAGGKDKGLSYSEALPYMRRVRKINLFGEAASKIHEDLEGRIKTEVFGTLREAVASSFGEAQCGDTVLFSPMCSSFDMFSNYKERGKKFIEIVNSLDNSS